MDKQYKDKLERDLVEAIWAFTSSIDESKQSSEKELARVIYNATNSAIVSSELDDLILRSRQFYK